MDQPKPKILVIDDEKVLRARIKALFRRGEYASGGENGAGESHAA